MKVQNRSPRLAGCTLLLPALLANTAHANNLTADLSRYPGTQPQLERGVAAQVRISIPLGGTVEERTSDRLRLDFEAGSQMAWTRRDGATRRALAPMVQYSLQPKKSEQLLFAGVPVHNVRLAPLSYSEHEAQVKGKARAGTVGKIAIGVGAAVAVAGLALFIALETQGPYD